MTRALVVFVFWLLPTVALSAQTDVIGQKLQMILDVAAPEALVPVIIRLRGRIDAGRFRQADRRERRRALVRSMRLLAEQSLQPVSRVVMQAGGRNARTLWMINGLAVKLPAASIRNLSNHPLLESIRLDEAIPLWHEVTPADSPTQWNLDMIHVPEVWARGYRGEGVVIASMDTGVDASHPDIGIRWRGGDNSWFDPNGEHASPADSNGHGTWTMGVMLGGDASGSAIGVAPAATWIAVKIFNDELVAPISAIHMGFQWLLDPDGDPATDDAPDVVNNSWGFEEAANSCITEFESDIQFLRTAGIAVVFAAGNTGPSPSSSVSPANNQGPVSVGAVDSGLLLANFSARGPSACDGGQFPHFSAPGVGIHTSDRCFGPLCDYVTVSGTSLSAPHVAGVMALLMGAVPDAGVDGIETALMQSSLDLGTVGPDEGYGYGLIDAVAALEALQCPPDGIDIDGDGVVDVCDNCIGIANEDQRDTNADGYGNLCDTDLNNDGITNGLDVGLIRSVYLSSDADADFNGDGSVNSLDIGLMKLFYLQPPGPSGLVP